MSVTVECTKEEKLTEQVIKLQDLVMFMDGMMRRSTKRSGSRQTLPSLPDYVFERP